MKKNTRYMVVDDDTTNNMICEFVIKRVDKEADIKIFATPEDALALIKEQYSSTNEAPPTVLFLDVNMTSMTGWEFLDIFVQFEEKVKEQFTIYILSSSIEDFTNELKIYSFIKGILSKPLKMNQLEGVGKELQE